MSLSSVVAGSGNDSIVVAGTAISTTLRAGVGDDLMSLAGGIASGSLYGGDGNDSFDFTGGAATGLVDTGAGVDSVLLGASADSITLTGVLTSTSVTAGSGADSILIKSNVASGYFDISAGAHAVADDTLNLLSSSVSAVSTTIKVEVVRTWSACMALTTFCSTLRPETCSLAELVPTPCRSPDQWWIPRSMLAAVLTAS